ncbi:MAG: hypothetical protein ACOX7N_07200 [Lawsonibacter sp.]|jgi:hypothetical protein
MKKVLLTTMIAALLIFPLEGVALAQSPDTPTLEISATQEGYVPGSAPAQTDALESMTPAIHGMILAMLNHHQTQFDASDRQLGWEALYNMLSLYGQMDARSEYMDEDLVLPVETAMDFSSALPTPMAELGALPTQLSDRMIYSSEIDSYRLACGNDSLAQVAVTHTAQINGQLDASGSLVYLVDNSTLAQFHAVLQPRDNLFGYTIVSLELL